MYHSVMSEVASRHWPDDSLVENGFGVAGSPDGPFKLGAGDILMLREHARELEARVERASALTEHHGLLKAKYENASNSPWISPDPDPPPPGGRETP